LSSLVLVPESPESVRSPIPAYPAISLLQFCKPVLPLPRHLQKTLPAACAIE
jgi:hypothetical protein